MHPHPEHKSVPLFVLEATAILLQGATVTMIVMIGDDIQGDACAQASLEWADNNAVRFEESKTEAILFSNRRKHRQCRREIRVGSTHRVGFAGKATRWLGIWLDASLNLEENRRRRIGKTRQAEAKLRRIVSQYGVPPASARNLQAAIVQGTMLYTSELTWNG